MAKSKLDPVQIAQLSFDEDLGASRVHLVDADIAIELSADDGDSVIVKKQTQAVPIKDGDIIDLSQASKVCLIGAESATLSAVLLDNEEILVYNISNGSIVNICLTLVKIGLDADKAYLMVQ